MISFLKLCIIYLFHLQKFNNFCQLSQLVMCIVLCMYSHHRHGTYCLLITELSAGGAPRFQLPPSFPLPFFLLNISPSPKFKALIP